MPKTLKQLEFNLSNNNLGSKIENMESITNGIKKLPNKLNNLYFDLSNNNLGENIQNMKFLRDILS